MMEKKGKMSYYDIKETLPGQFMIDVRITHFEHRNEISGVFQFKGRWYLADLIELTCERDLYDTPYEFMVFEADEQGKVIDWSGEFVLRPDAISEEILLQCIEEFCVKEEL